MSDPGGAAVPAAGEALDSRLRRIYIVGGEGSGKTTLATEFMQALGIPRYQLDEVAWKGSVGGSIPLFDPRYQPPEQLYPRPLEERLKLVRQVAERDAWVAEGKHLWWTAALLGRAEMIIWLDHVPFHVAARRILGRAARSGGRSFKQHRGHRKFTRFADYAVHSWDLAMQLRTLRYYYRGPAVENPDPDDYRKSITRASTARFLAPHADKVIHVETLGDLRRVIASVRLA